MGKKRDEGEEDKKISIRRELRDVGSQESSRKLRTGKHNQKIRTATVPVRRESRSSADLNLPTMHDWETSLLITITWGKKRELQIWSLRDCLDYIVSLRKSCNQSAKLLFLILNSYPPHPLTWPGKLNHHTFNSCRWVFASCNFEAVSKFRGVRILANSIVNFFWHQIGIDRAILVMKELSLWLMILKKNLESNYWQS